MLLKTLRSLVSLWLDPQSSSNWYSTIDIEVDDMFGCSPNIFLKESVASKRSMLLSRTRYCSVVVVHAVLWVADLHDNRKVGHANPEGVRSCCPSVIGVLCEVLEKGLPVLEVALDGDV